MLADASYLDGLTLVDPERGEVRLAHYWQAHMTVPFNVSNRCPVLSVPIGFGGNGLPIGMQIFGNPYAEVTVFRAGAAVEALQPWPLLAPVG